MNSINRSTHDPTPLIQSPLKRFFLLSLSTYAAAAPSLKELSLHFPMLSNTFERCFGAPLLSFPALHAAALDSPNKISMSSMVARTGRHRQRYEDQLRLVAGCIPYKLQKNDEDRNFNMENKALVLMISTPNRTDLVFPKGGWENDETVHEAACREALEEAGVKGLLGENPLGVWEFRSKSKQNTCGREGGCRGYMFALEVTEELDTWPEQASHERKWLSAEEAFEFCRYDWMRDALNKFLIALAKDGKEETIEKVEELPKISVSDTGAERQMLSPGCSGKASGVQHLEESRTKCYVQV